MLLKIVKDGLFPPLVMSFPHQGFDLMSLVQLDVGELVGLLDFLHLLVPIAEDFLIQKLLDGIFLIGQVIEVAVVF
jgi:hypothetical protein